MAQITYNDKVALNVNSNIADINKVNASDMNEIKASVNNNDDMLNGNAVAGNMVVNSIRTKNMFDSSPLVQGDVEGSTSTTRVSTRQILYLSAGTYTFSTNLPNTYRYGILIRPSAPPTSTVSSYDSGWITNTSTHTFTISTSGYFMMNFSKTDNTNLTPSDINAYDFQLEKGSTATAYKPYQNLDGMGKEIIQTTATPNSSYISTVQMNNVVKCGKIVMVDFRGLVSANMPNNTIIITLPYHFMLPGTAPAYLGGAYDYASTLWCSWGTNGNVFRAGSGFGSASGKYVHIHLVYITND